MLDVCCVGEKEELVCTGEALVMVGAGGYFFRPRGDFFGHCTLEFSLPSSSAPTTSLPFHSRKSFATTTVRVEQPQIHHGEQERGKRKVGFIGLAIHHDAFDVQRRPDHGQEGLHSEKSPGRSGHQISTPCEIFARRQVLEVRRRRLLYYNVGCLSDTFHRHRVTLKKRYGLLLTQQSRTEPAHVQPRRH